MYVDQTGQLGGGELSLLDVLRTSSISAEITLFADGPFRTALNEIGIRVHVLSSGSIAHVRRQAKVGSALQAVPQMIRMAFKLRRLARDFDVLYANSQKAFLVASLARRRDQVVVWHLRDMMTATHFSSTTRRIAVFFGNNAASLVIANSQATANSFVESGGKAELVRVIYNGIDVAPFDSVEKQKIRRFRERQGLTGKFVVGVFGRISPWKGQMILLEAAAQLKDIHVLVVGDALFNEEAYREELQIRAVLPDLQGRIHFLGFQKDIPLLMKAVDVVAHTSTSPEPFGRVIVEAMLAGRPVIATRAGGALEIVSEGESGLLVTPGSVQELENALLRIQRDAGLREHLASEGKRRAQDRFSVEAMTHGIETLLKIIAMGKD